MTLMPLPKEHIYTTRNPERDKKIVDLVREGSLTYDEIGILFGISGSRVFQIVEQQGVRQVRRIGRRPSKEGSQFAERNKQILEEVSKGELTYEEIGVLFELSAASIASIVSGTTAQRSERVADKLHTEYGMNRVGTNAFHLVKIHPDTHEELRILAHDLTQQERQRHSVTRLVNEILLDFLTNPRREE